MGFTTPLHVPLVKGMDQSNEAALGSDDLTHALNVDYPIEGAITGRPSRAAAKTFVVRDPSNPAPTYDAAAPFQSTNLTPRGLVQIGEGTAKAALGCEGRLFTEEAGGWVDRGPFHCARVDRLVNYRQQAYSGSEPRRVLIAPDFGMVAPVLDGTDLYIDFNLLDSTGAFQSKQRVALNNAGVTTMWAGNGVRCGNTTAAVASTTDKVLHLFLRTAGGSITRLQLATDAGTPTGIGDAPCVCTDGTDFFVVYITDTTDEFTVLKVDVAGNVTDSYTKDTSESSLHGIWIDTIAGGPVVVAFGHTSGLVLRKLSASDLTAGTDNTYSTGTADVFDLVVGLESDTKAWWVARTQDTDLLIGTANLSGTSTALMHQFLGGGTLVDAAIRWGIVHQPIRYNGRVYVTVAAATDPAGSVAATTGTWTTLDLTDAYGELGPNGVNVDSVFHRPSLVASGPVQATYTHFQPGSAWTLSDGWAFSTLDWTRLALDEGQGLDGLELVHGVSKVSMSGPKAVQAGSGTIFSGSIPHHLARGGQCAELGFPFLGGVPGIDCAATAGGAVGIGDYGIVAVWRWTDEAGQVHRSAPSIIKTATTSSGNNTLSIWVTNPWFSTHTDVVIEVYVTDMNPTEDAPHFLQTTAGPDWTKGYTTITINTQPVTNTDPLYSDGGAFAHYFVPGDGGVAAVGRRVWMAGAQTVYASKLLLPGEGPGFNDGGQLQVDIPADVGRVIALEGLSDKLVIFCERGIFLVQDGGPDNTGLGADFSSPARVSSLGIAGPRASVSAPDLGALFCVPFDATDPLKGGPWLITPGFELRYLGRAARAQYTTTWTPEVAYVPERQQAFITTDKIGPAGTVGSGHGVVMLDMRNGKWALWDTVRTTFGDLRHVVGVRGSLWALNNEPAPYSGAPGSDTGATAYAMEIATTDIPGNGTEGLGWAKVRAVHVLQAKGSGAHTLTIGAVQDGTRTLTPKAFTQAAPTADNTWPSSRQAPEWRLPVQKCSTIQLTLSASPATARWSAIQLDVVPLPARRPAKNRG